ncbi:MAG: DNA-processing protein DprA [Patescibacteria group bacterium]
MSQDIKTISISDNGFPARLREIPIPPQKISVWGKLPTEGNFLGIVGTRRCTAYGEEIVRKIVAGLVPHNFIIVSGLAVGIDTIAHKAALENNIPTIAVLGSGLSPNVLYPKQNVRLANEIASRGGAVISEHEFETIATTWSFPQRNRIISGLSSAVLVVEAPQKSGALNTAKFALDQNRDVCAVPGSIFAPNSTGSNKLIKQGAHLIESAEDILRLYNIEIDEAQNATLFDDISPEEKNILSVLTEPMDVDMLIRKSKIPTSSAHAIIGLMEIRGIIKRIGSDYIKM